MYNRRRAAFSRLDPGLDEHKPWAAVGAWFPGPKGENADVYKELVVKAIDHHMKFREDYYPSDPVYVDDEMKQSECYRNAIAKMDTQLQLMLSELDKSIPFFSTRYKVGTLRHVTSRPLNYSNNNDKNNNNNDFVDNSPVKVSKKC